MWRRHSPIPFVINLTGLVELFARALKLLPPDSLGAGRLLAQYGQSLGREAGDYKGAQNALERALAIARREKDTALEMQTLGYATATSFLYLHLQEGLKYGLQAIEARDIKLKRLLTT